MEWKTVYSDTKPSETDTTSSSEYNYVRQNVQEVTITDPISNESKISYQYQELLVKKENWDMYQILMKNQADIAYLTLMQDA